MRSPKASGPKRPQASDKRSVSAPSISTPAPVATTTTTPAAVIVEDEGATDVAVGRNTNTNSINIPSPILAALRRHEVTAEITDLDHFRIGGGLAVETDYIITVRPPPAPPAAAPAAPSSGGDKNGGAGGSLVLFDTFTISKSYSAFRSLASALKKAADTYTSDPVKSKAMPETAIKAAKYCELVSHLIESQRTQYLGKVNYMFVKVLAKQRGQIINDVLEATCTYFPDDPSAHPLLGEIAALIETFFLTDHCEAVATAPAQPHQHPPAFDDLLHPPRHRKKPSLSSEGSVGGGGGGPLNPLNWFGSNSNKSLRSGSGGPSSSIVVPMSTKSRASNETREREDFELKQVGDEANFTLEESAMSSSDAAAIAAAAAASGGGTGQRPRVMVPNYSRPTPVVKSGGSWLGDVVESSPMVFAGIVAISAWFLHRAALNTVKMDGDVALLGIFAAFCLGLHMPRPLVGGFDQPPTMKGVVREDVAGRRLLRRSMVATTPRGAIGAAAASMSKRISMRLSMRDVSSLNLLEEDDVFDELDDEDEAAVLRSPLPMFPPGAKMGSVMNCWSEPNPFNFNVRGPNYLSDKKKVPSDEFLFPVRGVDLFLTDTCPENVGRNSSVFGGNLRDKPTFIVNFRLPWGVLLFYYEIPDKFLPFIKACNEDDFDHSKLPSLDDMTPGERSACRFLLRDTQHKNETLKIVPYVVEGPWVVKQVVGGKPAIIGTKLPVNYVYQPEELGGKDKKAMYLEADLDIAGSSAARGILSVTRSYTNILTLDMGFVVQGNEQDELPECMLIGTRIHGVDPLTAPCLPPDKNMFMTMDDDEDTESVSPVVMARE